MRPLVGSRCNNGYISSETIVGFSLVSDRLIAYNGANGRVPPDLADKLKQVRVREKTISL